MQEKKLVFTVAGLFILLGAVFFGKDVFVKKVTAEVIKELRREYAPGPYSPGFDPDKVDPSFWKSK
jgi:hypothetical protein